MAVSSVSKDMEALVDLFLSPAFYPFVPEYEPPRIGACLQSGSYVHEAEVVERESATQPVHNAAFTRHCGRVLAKLGDDFYKSYKPKENSTATGPPWLSIDEKLRSIFNTATQTREIDPNSEEEAWRQFKEIMTQAFADTPAVDVYRQLGALLLTLHGLSDLVSGVRSLARTFFIRYIRERNLDTQIQNLGGLDHLMAQEVD